MSEKKTFVEHRPPAPRRTMPTAAPVAPIAPPRPAAAPPRDAGTGTKPEPRAVPEIGGPAGPDPTRYGDWESKGRCIDF